MIELACKDLVFHFNKGHLKDPTIPMWVVKTKGKTYYVHHVEATIPWSTKETPDNEHTKGSIKFKNCLCTIDDDNNCTLTPLTEEDEDRLSGNKVPTRVMYMGYSYDLESVLDKHEIPHTEVKTFTGECTTKKQICDILDKSTVTMLILLIPEIRLIVENEVYWDMYDNAKYKSNEDYDEEHEDPEPIF